MYKKVYSGISWTCYIQQIYFSEQVCVGWHRTGAYYTA